MQVWGKFDSLFRLCLLSIVVGMHRLAGTQAHWTISCSWDLFLLLTDRVKGEMPQTLVKRRTLSLPLWFPLVNVYTRALRVRDWAEPSSSDAISATHAIVDASNTVHYFFFSPSKCGQPYIFLELMDGGRLNALLPASSFPRTLKEQKGEREVFPSCSSGAILTSSLFSLLILVHSDSVCQAGKPPTSDVGDVNRSLIKPQMACCYPPTPLPPPP